MRTRILCFFFKPSRPQFPFLVAAFPAKRQRLSLPSQKGRQTFYASAVTCCPFRAMRMARPYFRLSSSIPRIVRLLESSGHKPQARTSPSLLEWLSVRSLFPAPSQSAKPGIVLFAIFFPDNQTRIIRICRLKRAPLPTLCRLAADGIRVIPLFFVSQESTSPFHEKNY